MGLERHASLTSLVNDDSFTTSVNLFVIYLSIEKYALRAPKEDTPDLMRYAGPVWSICCSLQNIKMNFNCFSNDLSSNNLCFPWWKSSKLPLERLIMPTEAVQTQKSSKQTIPAFPSHSVSVPEEETSPHRPVWLSFPHHESTVMLLCVTVHYWSLRYTDAQARERERERERETDLRSNYKCSILEEIYQKWFNNCKEHKLTKTFQSLSILDLVYLK